MHRKKMLWACKRLFSGYLKKVMGRHTSFGSAKGRSFLFVYGESSL